MTGDRGLEWYQGDLNDHNVTIAEVLNQAGYATYMSGKWHVTPRVATKASRRTGRFSAASTSSSARFSGAGSFYDPGTLTRGNQYIPPYKAGPDITNESFYYTDAISTNAVRYVEDHAANSSDQPMFMYVAYTAPHWPLHAPEKTIEKYEGVYDKGWGAIRKQCYQRMKEMGLIKDQWKLFEQTGRVTPWEKVEHKK
jgi:arylsulfatase